MTENKFYDSSYTHETLQHLKKVEVSMLEDVIEICDKYGLHYYLHAGSLLGAIRHEGFIPWDDEIDVGMFREDYEKFLKIIVNEYSHKYYLLNWKIDFNIEEDVFTPQTFLCLKNTKVYGLEDKGIYIDIAVMDIFPKNSVKQFIFIKILNFIHFMIHTFYIVNGDKFTTDFREFVAKTIKFTLNFIHITPKTILKLYTRIFSKKDINNCTHVCNSSYYYDKPLPIEPFREFISTKFESTNVCIPKDYEVILKIYYGDYMELPPIDKREDHDFNPIDFGEY